MTDLTNIHVEGKPLKEILEEIPDSEIEEVRKSEQKKSLYHNGVIKFRKITSKSESHGDVRVYTDDEIRRERGIMSKPFKTQIENVLWTIKHKGPITVKQIAEDLNYKTERISACMANVWNAVGEGQPKSAKLIGRHKIADERGFAYFCQTDDSVDKLYGHYKDYQNARAMKFKTKKRAKKATGKLTDSDTVIIMTEIKNILDNEIEKMVMAHVATRVATYLNNNMKNIAELIAKESPKYVNESSNIDVNVNGKVEFVFKWGR